MECSMVIVFNEKGEYINHYMFSSELFYEDYATKKIMQGGDHLGRRVSLTELFELPNILRQMVTLMMGCHRVILRILLLLIMVGVKLMIGGKILSFNI